MIVRVSDKGFVDLGLTNTGELDLLRVIERKLRPNIEVENMEGLDWWPDPETMKLLEETYKEGGDAT